MSKKIGYYFVESLPNREIHGDDFSFYYVKNNVNINGNVVNIPDVYLYNKELSTFFRLDIPKDYQLQKINDKFVNNGVINLGLNNILQHNNETNIPLKLNDNYLYSKSNGIFFINKIIPDDSDVLNSIILGDNFSVDSRKIISKNDIYLGNNLNISNNSDSNIVIGNSLEIIDSTKDLNNNLFIGGIYFTENNTKINNNIYIKNLGFGNTQTEFNFSTPIKLSVNTPIVENIDKNLDYILVDKASNNKVSKILLNNINLNFILENNNSTTKNINFNGNKIGYYPVSKSFISSVNVYEEPEPELQFRNDDTIHNNFYFGNLSDTTKIINNLKNTINIGNNALEVGFNSINIGNNNIANCSDSTIFGNNIYKNSTQTSSRNTIFGNDNFKNITENDIIIQNNTILGFQNAYQITNDTPFTNNIILGTFNSRSSSGKNNILLGTYLNNYNKGSNNFFVGNNSFDSSENKNINNSIILGNYAESWLSLGLNYQNLNANSLLIINDYTEDFNSTGIIESKRPLIYGSFLSTNKFLEINGKVIINPNYVPNTTIDITYDRILTQNSFGEIGYVTKDSLNIPKIKKYIQQTDIVINNTKEKTSTDLNITLLANKTYRIKIMFMLKDINYSGEYLNLHADIAEAYCFSLDATINKTGTDNKYSLNSPNNTLKTNMVEGLVSLPTNTTIFNKLMLPVEGSLTVCRGSYIEVEEII